jgi:ATP-dependent Clp protease adaptor protein ClpS
VSSLWLDGIGAQHQHCTARENARPTKTHCPAPLDSWAETFYFKAMATTAHPEVRPDIDRDEQTDSRTDLEPGYLVICWNDPVNLMDYVTHVFQVVFGWQRQKAELHMLQVHRQGKSVLKRESMEKAEFYVHQLQKYTLHATMERD